LVIVHLLKGKVNIYLCLHPLQLLLLHPPQDDPDGLFIPKVENFLFISIEPQDGHDVFDDLLIIKTSKSFSQAWQRNS